MNHPMRRNKQALEPRQTEEILERGTSGTLALIDEEGLPYAVPLSYVYWEGKLYFHGAREGHKIQAIRANPAASFCVIDQDQVIPRQYTTYYRSVIVFGTLAIVEDPALALEAIQALGRKYSPGLPLEEEIRKNQGHYLILELTPERITGKESIELKRQAENR